LTRSMCAVAELHLTAAAPAVLDTVDSAERASGVPDRAATADQVYAGAVRVPSDPPAVDVMKDQLLRQQRPARRLASSPAAWLLAQQPDNFTRDEHNALDKLQKAVSEIARAYTLAQGFVRIVRERTVEAFAGGIERAAAACLAALGSSPVDSKAILLL